MNHREQIGQRIAQLRKEKGYSIRQLADRSGVNFANIYKIENGKYNVSIDILGKVCDALGCRIDIVKNLGEYILSKDMKEELINQFKEMSGKVDARGNLDNLKEER